LSGKAALVSELFDILYNVISPIFLIVAIAFFIGRRFNPDPRTLSTILIYLFIPALSFRTMLQLDIDGISDIVNGDFGRAFAQITFALLIMMSIGMLVGRVLKLDRRTSSAFTLSVTQLNAGNLGLPVNAFAFGPAGGEIALLFYVSSALAGNMIGVFIASRGEKSVGAALVNVLRVPVSLAALVGLAMNTAGVTLPLPMERALFLVADATLPGMIVLLGLLISRMVIRDARWGLVALASALRLLGGAAVGVVLASLLGQVGVAHPVSILQCAMPTAVMANALATEFGGDTQLTSAVTLVSTLASIVTLTVLIAVLR
jgi:malate permease and related proteins